MKWKWKRKSKRKRIEEIQRKSKKGKKNPIKTNLVILRVHHLMMIRVYQPMRMAKNRCRPILISEHVLDGTRPLTSPSTKLYAIKILLHSSNRGQCKTGTYNLYTGLWKANLVKTPT